jgi:GNAT superfamily N-acetyltransferase
MSTADPAGLQLTFCADPGEFLAVAGGHLAAAPVLSTVVTTITERLRSRLADGVPLPERSWWLVVRDGTGGVVGAGMRTATFPPYPPFLLPMPESAAVALARTLHQRGEEVLGLNGALPAARRCAEELARLAGGRVEVAQHTRLHELGELTPPAPVPGRLVPATDDDLDLVAAWFAAFMADADEQAGRVRGSSAHEVLDRDELRRRVRAGRLWFWLDGHGRRVHLTGANPPAYGVARLGPVYTPPSERGRGWASNAVAEVSRRIQADGVRVCLFTDQANPTSNKIYAALGYRPVVDMTNLVLVR